jgi:hypothetical protein
VKTGGDFILLAVMFMLKRSRWDQGLYPHEVPNQKNKVVDQPASIEELMKEAQIRVGMVLEALRNLPITSITWRFERKNALRLLSPTWMVDLYNNIAINASMRDATIEDMELLEILSQLREESEDIKRVVIPSSEPRHRLTIRQKIWTPYNASLWTSRHEYKERNVNLWRYMEVPPTPSPVTLSP